MSDASKHIAETLRQRPLQPRHITRETVGREVRDFLEHSLADSAAIAATETTTTRQVIAELTGFGALQPAFDDPTIEEIWINGPHDCFVARNGVSERLAITLSPDDIRLIVDRMLMRTGRRVDLSQPFVDASLPDGSRLHVAIPDITRTHWSVNIRKFHREYRSLPALVQRGMLSSPAAGFLQAAMRAGLNTLVSGPTHVGKTTLLSALLAAGQPNERVVTVEETFEISCPSRDHVGLQCRPANIEGGGEISLRRLVKEALRMRPDRLVVGEVREAESLDLLIALNSGIPGLATLHANSARDALLKMCTLPLLAGRNIDAHFVLPTVASSIDLVVHAQRSASGFRYVAEILALTGAHSGGAIDAHTLFRADPIEPFTLRPTGNTAVRPEKFRAAGIDPLEWLVAA